MSIKDDASATTTIAIWGLVVIMVITLFAFAARLGGFGIDSIFAPKEEALRHKTFECSDAHVDGLTRELREIREQWSHADAAGKAELVDTFKHEYDGFTCGQLPADVQSFYNEIQ